MPRRRGNPTPFQFDPRFGLSNSINQTFGQLRQNRADARTAKANLLTSAGTPPPAPSSSGTLPFQPSGGGGQQAPSLSGAKLETGKDSEMKASKQRSNLNKVLTGQGFDPDDLAQIGMKQLMLLNEVQTVKNAKEIQAQKQKQAQLVAAQEQANKDREFSLDAGVAQSVANKRASDSQLAREKFEFEKNKIPAAVSTLGKIESDLRSGILNPEEAAAAKTKALSSPEETIEVSPDGRITVRRGTSQGGIGVSLENDLENRNITTLALTNKTADVMNQLSQPGAENRVGGRGKVVSFLQNFGQLVAPGNPAFDEKLDEIRTLMGSLRNQARIALQFERNPRLSVEDIKQMKDFEANPFALLSNRKELSIKIKNILKSIHIQNDVARKRLGKSPFTNNTEKGTDESLEAIATAFESEGLSAAGKDILLEIFFPDTLKKVREIQKNARK